MRGLLLHDRRFRRAADLVYWLLGRCPVHDIDDLYQNGAMIVDDVYIQIDQVDEVEQKG